MHFLQSMTQKERKPLLLPSWRKNMKEWAQLFFRHQQINTKTPKAVGNQKYAQRNFIMLFIFTFTSMYVNKYTSKELLSQLCRSPVLPVSGHLVHCRTQDGCGCSLSWWEHCAVALQLGSCLCRLDLDLSTRLHIATVTVGRGFTLFLGKKKK